MILVVYLLFGLLFLSASIILKVLAVFLIESDLFGNSAFIFRRNWSAKFIVLIKVEGINLNALHHSRYTVACLKDFSLIQATGVDLIQE